MTECVKVDCGRRFRTEFFGEITASDENLTDKALACGHIAVGLQISTADDVPFSLADQLFDLCKQRGRIFFNIFI